MVQIGDVYMLVPSVLCTKDGAGWKRECDAAYPGTVTGIYPHGFALVDFGSTRECRRLSELETAPKAPKKRRRRK